MIKKLRIRFIIIAMLSVVLVMGTILFAINFINYNTCKTYADSVLDSLIANDGIFKQNRPIDKNINNFDNNLSEETPYETRYFVVKYNDDYVLESVNTSAIASIDINEAVDFAYKVIKKGNTRGYIDNYRYGVAIDSQGLNMIVFMDCSRELSTRNQFLESSIRIGIVAIIGVFILVYVFSKSALIPIEESYKKQKQFVTDASHELKTPLTIISANNEIIEMEYGENESSNAIKKQITRMTAMVGALTMLSKIDENETIDKKEKFSLSDTVDEVSFQFEKTAEANNKYLSCDIEHGIDYEGDLSLIRQLISIILENAVKYAKSIIHLELRREKGKIILTCINDTTGIEMGVLDKYFDRFYRSDTMRASSIEGSGIGLSIAKEIVRLHKANISASSADGVMFEIKIEF